MAQIHLVAGLGWQLPVRINNNKSLICEGLTMVEYFIGGNTATSPRQFHIDTEINSINETS